MDYQSLGNIFKGLAASGSWGCFDEFNRLIPEVLSVCTVQFKAVCDGIVRFEYDQVLSHLVVIEGDQVNLDPTCGAFITMNPVCEVGSVKPASVLLRDTSEGPSCQRDLRLSFDQ
mmetsp:Transcript_30055/g.92965  ORF Transcript_30055/g.92965 Transcript_30055/m.92965 type:complete len:115 (+) Transcript_30055:4578-4922(+)